MAKDKLGLDWNRKKKPQKKHDDNSLYNALIITLVIGIIVVIATLLLTRPAPESFTELYFNNHLSLPEYVEENTQYNFSFSINNLENRDMGYDYVVSADLYDINYACEQAELWLEQANVTDYEELMSQSYDLPTRSTETKDPDPIHKRAELHNRDAFHNKSRRAISLRHEEY